MDTKELKTTTIGGWAMLFALLVVAAGLAYLSYAAIHRTVVAANVEAVTAGHVIGIIVWGLAVMVWSVLMFGFFTLQPNMSAVLILFGKYKGTEHTSGFRWANPLLIKKKVSLRAHNLNVQTTVYTPAPTEDYEDYITVQSESALRHLAMAYS